jgi:nitrite reductase/ring-hydroxylating ferredoxin subunit/uncharacterized membrane protein
MEPLFRELVAHRIEQLESLDQVSKPVQDAVNRAVPPDSQLKDLLSGTWLGHPLHPLLTDVVIGAWTSAAILDLLGGRSSRSAADRLIAVGCLAAVPTAAAGLSDWAELWGGVQRVGITHAMGNVTALLLQTLSWRARKRGRRVRGKLWSALGMAVAGGSAYLGGHLSFGKGVGVNQTAFDSYPSRWKVALEEAEVEEGSMKKATVAGMPVLVARVGGEVYAIHDKCSHRGCGLHSGTLADTSVVCPCHGSTFRLADGSIVKGPATAPQPAFEVRVRDGKIEVRAPQHQIY